MNIELAGGKYTIVYDESRGDVTKVLRDGEVWEQATGTPDQFRVVTGDFILALVHAILAQYPIPMLLWCPLCHQRHIDEGEFATKVHTSHACQHCGHVWRPAIAPTVGVQFLPGFKNTESRDSR